MPDPIQTICNQTPGATYFPQTNSCRWSNEETGTEMVMYRNQEGTIVIRGVGRPAPPTAPTPPAPAAPTGGRTRPFNNIGISSAAISRMYDIQTILICYADGLSPKIIRELKVEFRYLLQALYLGCDIRIAQRLLAEEDPDIEEVSAVVARINANLNLESISSLTADARSALCSLYNDPNVDLPSLPDALWNLICE